MMGNRADPPSARFFFSFRVAPGRVGFGLSAVVDF
jgi:hypothetical protein